MSDYIKREDAINAFYTATGDGDKAEWCVGVIQSIPAADVVERPLTPVPPHGRLIDADALTETFRERKRPTLSDGADGSKERVRYLDFISAIQTIKETPTIIPSELRKKSGKNP